MKDRNGQNGRRRPRKDASEIGVIRVFSKPGPDAEDRLRRLMSLMIKYATQDGQAEPHQEDSPDERSGDESSEAGA